jgi:Ca2+-binding EF-hand superfamily protein
MADLGSNSLDPFDARIAAAMPLFEAAGGAALSGHALKCAFGAALGFRPSKHELQRLLGAGRDGMRWPEFAAIARSQLVAADPRDDLRRLFRLFDVHGRGFVEFADFERACREAAPHLPRAAIADAFVEADTLGTGRVSYPQFEKLMLEGM